MRRNGLALAVTSARFIVASGMRAAGLAVAVAPVAAGRALWADSFGSFSIRASHCAYGCSFRSACERGGGGHCAYSLPMIYGSRFLDISIVLILVVLLGFTVVLSLLWSTAVLSNSSRSLS